MKKKKILESALYMQNSMMAERSFSDTIYIYVVYVVYIFNSFFFFYNLVVRDGDEFFARSDCRKWSFDGQNTVLAERGLDALGIRSFRQQEFPVVLPVDGLALGLLLVLGVDL